MSTHNIGFYEDLTKIIFELSSNIIKYAPYFFCWLLPSACPKRVGLLPGQSLSLLCPKDEGSDKCITNM